MNWFKRRKLNKFGNHIFTFPDGAKLYQLKEDYFERLPNVKLEYIQENTNYIAHLGVSKHTLFSAVEKSQGYVSEVKALKPTYDLNTKTITIRVDDLERIYKRIENLDTTLKYIDTNNKENDKTQEHILVSMFDMFFFFEDEDMFEWSEQSLERKRYYLSEYPYFRNFFFRKLEDYSTIYKSTYENVIRYAIVQTGIQGVIKDLLFTSISEAGTESEPPSLEHLDSTLTT